MLFLAVISILNFWYSQSFHCNSNCGPDGLFPEELPAVSIPVSELSQCTRPQFCDDSAPSTGHQLVLEQSLTEAAISVEQCYSLCFVRHKLYNLEETRNLISSYVLHCKTIILFFFQISQNAYSLVNIIGIKIF